MDMMHSFKIRQTRFLMNSDRYRITPHSNHDRLFHVELNETLLRSFFQYFDNTNVQNLQYVPYARFILAKKLEELFGSEFKNTLRSIVTDRDTGGFTIGVQGITKQDEDYVKFGTAVSHLIGPANMDAMSGTYFARFVVKHTDNSDSYLRQAYRTMTLHTDGTFVDEPTDWLLMMKLDERNAVGGESRLLHLDDWADLEIYAQHPLASYKFTYTSPPSKNISQTTQRRTFFKVNGKPCICFIDQFVQPETIEHATYLKNLSDSVENSPATVPVSLPVGNLVMLNNTFWMHGRAAFETNPNLHRELMRQRGTFSEI